MIKFELQISFEKICNSISNVRENVRETLCPTWK